MFMEPYTFYDVICNLNFHSNISLIYARCSFILHFNVLLHFVPIVTTTISKLNVILNCLYLTHFVFDLYIAKFSILHTLFHFGSFHSYIYIYLQLHT